MGHRIERPLIELIIKLVAQMAKNLPAVKETRVQSLGWEDHLEKEMATHSSILAWEIPWTEEPGRLQSMGLKRVRYDSDFPYTTLIELKAIGTVIGMKKNMSQSNPGVLSVERSLEPVGQQSHEPASTPERLVTLHIMNWSC